jgi:hypothetical protein
MRLFLFSLYAALFLSAVLPACGFGAAPYDREWKEVDAAVTKGLPKTAIEKLGPLIDAAIRDQAYAAAIRATAMKISLQGTIEGNKPEEKVVRMRAAITNAPAEMRTVLDAILANWYWHYYQQNRWRFLQRTQTTEAPGDDFTTWDLKRILGAIDSQFQKALSGADALKKTPIAAYDDLLEKGGMPDTCRPTLYDFIAFSAMEFYASDDQAGLQSEDRFVLQPESPIFEPLDAFLDWRIETPDAESLTVKALRLYQDVLAFHRADANPDALYDADLLRIEFGGRRAAGEMKNTRHRDALKRYAETRASHPFSARARAAWACVVLTAEKNPVAARAIAARGLADFPTSIGGALCHNLIQEIDAHALQIETERVWNACQPDLTVSYRNLTHVYFRVYGADFAARMRGKDVWRSPSYLDREEAQRLLKTQPALEWDAALPATTNYLQRTARLPPPMDLKPGFYFLLASARQDFGETDNQIAATAFWVSDLALVLRTRNESDAIEGFVLQAASGEPIAGARVDGWSQMGDKRSTLPGVTTDAQGFFRIEKQSQHYFLLRATSGNQTISTIDNQWLYRNTPPTWPQEQTVFFTDRALYRPGQTVRYKGICLRYDPPKGAYATLADRTVTVVFYDSNHKEVARQDHTLNAYGSFDGSFVAPRDRVTGSMHLNAANGPSGSVYFRVEEYKRPKFQVTVDAPKEAARLGGEVAVSGHAKTYTGMPVAGAKVSYRVAREVRYPMWWGWCCRWWFWAPPQQSGQEIAHGVATTDDEGAFTVRFTARPAPEVDPKTEATFAFTVHADATDSTGETRSGDRSVLVGFTALQASMTADGWQTTAHPVKIAVRTTSPDGEGRAAKGIVKIHRLIEPEQVARARMQSPYGYPYPAWAAGTAANRAQADDPDLSDPNAWELGKVATDEKFRTDDAGQAELKFKLRPGAYRAMLETQDAFGKTVTARLPLLVIDEDATRFPVRLPNYLAVSDGSLQPGETFRAVWGSGYAKARAFVEVESQGRAIQRYWTTAGRTQNAIEQEVGENLRGGFTLRLTFVRDNRAYLVSRIVDVPWSNQVLNVSWERFVSKLGPGKQETWTAVVAGTNASLAAAEMVATLYDASLDAYVPHVWERQFQVFRHEYDTTRSQFVNDSAGLQNILASWRSDYRGVDLTYRHLPYEIAWNLLGYSFGARKGGARMRADRGVNRNAMDGDWAATPRATAAPRASAAPMEANGRSMDKAKSELRGDDFAGGMTQEPASDPAASAALDAVSARKNLDESAFFFPHLTTDDKGRVRMEFTMPEALTEWRFMAFAHDRNLRAGYLQDKAVTAKDLMVEPNPPRFVREGDTVEFTVKVSNRSAVARKGSVRLTFRDAATLASADPVLGNTAADQSFSLAAGVSRSFSWRITVPDGAGFLNYKAVGVAGDLSDGEEGWLPVLSRRILVTESLPLPVRGRQTKEFTFGRLLDSAKSDTLRNQNLTVQMVSQPAWYAVMALPYLMEQNLECSEAVFNRLYANSLARHIGKSNPKIRRIFDLWKGTDALQSPLEKNQDLKSVLLEETPWVRQAQNETQARRNVGILFDENRLNDESRRDQAKLAEMQYGDGRWPWFAGGRPCDYFTLYVATGYGRLRHLGVQVDTAPAVKAFGYLDGWIDRMYREILRDGHPNENHLSSTIALYLYGRSFFLDDIKFTGKHREAVDYFLGQSRKYWLALANRQSQAHLAIALKRFDDPVTAKEIVDSIRERSVTNDEMGMFWRELELSWWWFRAPIETQAMMIELFAEVAGDDAAVEACKVWLLKQKQTQDWKTTKATADAVYSLLLRGTDLLASDARVEVALNGKWIEPSKVEAGTGFYEQRFAPEAIVPAMGRITVKKVDDGVSWGSVHWQYLEDMTKITPYAGTPLTLRKTLFVKENSKRGPELRPVKGPLEVGQELVVRIELRTDRDMEYVHLKDQRGCGTEPLNVLSHYRYQDGLAYYESTRDTASHFYIDYLPKGVYVFEYSTRVVHRGRYQSGIAEVQCLYAPEFNSHSESFNLDVK